MYFLFQGDFAAAFRSDSVRNAETGTVFCHEHILHCSALKQFLDCCAEILKNEQKHNAATVRLAERDQGLEFCFYLNKHVETHGLKTDEKHVYI